MDAPADMFFWGGWRNIIHHHFTRLLSLNFECVLFCEQKLSTWTRGCEGAQGCWSGGQGGIFPQILVDQLTLSLLKRADNAHQITNCPPDFHAFRRPWDTKRNHLISNIGTPWKKRSINRNLNYWKRTLVIFKNKYKNIFLVQILIDLKKFTSYRRACGFQKFVGISIYGGCNLPPPDWNKVNISAKIIMTLVW